MENTNQETKLEGNEIVVSGMSGIFPKSNSVSQFMENLYNKVDMVMTVNSGLVHPNSPNHIGKITGLEKFDAHFFKVPVNQAISMDPLCRKLMEQSYSAIYDAGVNPLGLDGTKIGVYTGINQLETIIYNWYKHDKSNAFMMSGCALTMVPNRISYYLNVTGPSFDVIGANASSLVSLDLAYKDLKAGVIDGAIVAGCNRCMIPSLSINLKRCGFLCDDGKTKCFDKHGDGYVRSEAISVIYLQKARDAKRIYCEIYGTRTKYSKPDIHAPIVRREHDIVKHFEEFYEEMKVDPSDVEYVEANATGIATCDEIELKAIDNFFGGRSKVNIGSVKSNMGNSEGASGICALTKICLAYHKGVIPPNINCHDAIETTENSILVKNNTPFGRGYAAINELCYTGIDCHTLLKGYFKPKNIKRYRSNIPYLVFSSGRQKSCVDYLFDVLESNSLDPEYIGLLHNIHSNEIRGHTTRGCIILDKDVNKETVTLSRSIGHYPGNKRQVCFVFSGMGSQWVGMGAELMRIEIFSEAIKKCDNVLRSKGIDIIKIITEKDDTIFDSILNCFVGIATVQIGLIDILRAVGIECDYMIGHSVGETACGYADGCFTAEEMILSAYSRGIASMKTDLIPGAMAAVGLGFKELHSLCPPDIDIACHNSSTSSTISGPAESISKFVKELKLKNIFAKEVPTSNIAYHSRYIAAAGPTLRSLLDNVIIEPKLRSEKWLSTSVTENNWQESYAQHSSAEYFTNNLLNSVYFEETSRHIPSDAIVIEVAPHGLLQAVLKRSHPDCLHIPLTRREADDPVKFLLQALGKIYQAGVCVKIDALYPKINFPVSTGTPFLSHLIKWEHSEDWPIFDEEATKSKPTHRTRNIAISVYDENYISIQGYKKNGVIVFPESALLVLTWETLAIFMDIDYRHLPVVFKHLKFNDHIIVNKQKILKFNITITNEGRFEVTFENKVIVSGFIAKMQDREIRVLENSNINKENNIILKEPDIYKYLNLRNHVYRGDFRSIYSLNPTCNEAYVKWIGDWVTFIDGLIQINTFVYNNDGVSKPRLIESVTIDVHEHLNENHQSKMKGNILYKAEYYSAFDVVRSGGVELVNIVFEDIVLEYFEPDFVGTKQFWPCTLNTEVDLNTALHISIQVIAEDVANKEINIIDFCGPKTNAVSDVLKEIITKIPVEIRINSIDVESYKMSNQYNDYTKPDVLIVDDIVTRFEKLTAIYDMLPSNGYVLTLEKRQNEIYIQNSNLFNIITSYHINSNNKIVLLKKNENNQTTEDLVLIKIENIESIKKLLNNKNFKPHHKKTILLSDTHRFSDYSGYLRKLQEEYGNRIRLFQILDTCAPPFDLKNEFYRKQILKNLLYNTLLDGEWGGYYYTNINYCTSLSQKPNLKLKEFDDLQFLEQADLDKGHINYVQVKCTGISLADSDKIISNYSSKNITYQDFSGIDESGNRVMGLFAGRTNSRNIVPDLDLLWPVPDSWTLEEAATVPLPYVHAFYCLAIRSKLRRKQTVFINGAAGALGQALIAICLSLNCDVYVSVRDIFHKICLLKIFPELNENKVLSSLNSNLVAAINTYTNNKRCEIVINREEGFLRESAMKCVAFNGYFLDMSKVDAIENKQFGLTYLWECKNYKTVEVSNIFRPENYKDKKILHSIITEAIAKGIVRPISHISYSHVDLSKDVSLLASKNQEKVIITLEDQFICNAKKGLIFNEMHTCLIIGGQDELCVGLVSLLLNKGAKSIFLNLNTKSITPFLQIQLRKWENQGILVKLGYHKIDNQEECRNLCNDAAAMGPIDGIFTLLSCVQSVLSKTEKGNELLEVCQIKSSLINLDNVSRDITSIRYFAILSRNITTLEDEFLYSISRKICELRNFKGLPSFLYRAEYVDETQSYITLVKDQQVRHQTVREVINCFEKAIATDFTNVLSFNTSKNVKVDYLQKLTEALDIKCSKAGGLKILKDLEKEDLDKLKMEELTNLIYEYYDLNISVKELKEMSLESIQNIDRELSKYYNNDLNVIISNVNHNPYKEVESMKLMHTSLYENLENCYEVESIDPAADYLLLLPGYEGNHEIFETLCLGLEFKAMTYELGPELAGETIPEMAANIMKNLLLKFDNKKKFYILGYSFGVNLAFELAALLEKKGLIGVIFCLDTSPETLRIEVNTYTSNLSESELQDSLINHIYNLVTKETNIALKEELKKYETFDEKLNLFIQTVKKEVSYSHEYMRLMLESTYKRMMLSLNYNPTFVLNSELILVKAKHSPGMKHIEDYDLSNFSNKPVKIFNINTDHRKVPSNVQVPAIINKILRLMNH